MGFEARSSMLSAVREPALLSDPTKHDEPIGARLEEGRLRLVALIDRLGDLLGEHAAPLLEAASRQLHQRCCRIAVIGQIKAGKSTFINALAERPGFLPADINPWTAVVTALHFRNSPTPPEHAAVFHLFSADQWKELAEGGGRLRELTERLVPGFQPDLLRAQLEVMRKRAERRLGSKFAELLGQVPSLQDRDARAAVRLRQRRRRQSAIGGPPRARKIYSDVTRSADLYFNESPFAYPITLIDTPGTNDPFLVRDEITRRSLENPDVYVFVISALQPLSAADIYMLRLLNGLHKDRIVVFINRADQLANPGHRRRLDKGGGREAPASGVPGARYSRRLRQRLARQSQAAIGSRRFPRRPQAGPTQGSAPGRPAGQHRHRRAAAFQCRSLARGGRHAHGLGDARGRECDQQADGHEQHRDAPAPDRRVPGRAGAGPPR